MKRLISLTIASLMLLLSACGNNASSGEQPAAEGPKDLVVALGSEPISLDPQDASDGISLHATELIYDKLVTFDKDMKIVPELAKEWSMSEDGKSWTFTLQEGAKFQDGEPVNAEAVKASFDRILDKNNKLKRRSLFADFIESVSVESEYKVSFQLKFQYAPLLATLAHPNGGIHSPKNTAEKGKGVGKSPVGSGPYQFKEWISGEKLVLEANPNYWGEKPKVKSITFKPVVENAARSLMLETGEADVILPIPATDIERLKSNDQVKVELYPSNRNLYMGMNTQKAPFDNVKVRQALNYAVDKETIVNKIMMGNAKPAEAAISGLTWGYSPVGTYPYDPEKAKQLLAEAGVKPGTTIKLWTPEGRYLMDRQLSEFVQANLQAVGFNVEFRKWEWGAYQEAIDDPNSGYDLFLLSWAVPTNDADWGLRPNFSTEGSNNRTLFSNAELDALIDQGMKTTNEEERKQIYAKALQIIKDEAPWIFLVEMKQPIGVRKNVEGVYGSNTERLILRDADKK